MSKPPDNSLADFQDRLLELLAAGKAPADVRVALLADASLSGFHSYIESMDDRMITVAAELVGKWSTKGTPS